MRELYHAAGMVYDQRCLTRPVTITCGPEVVMRDRNIVRYVVYGLACLAFYASAVIAYAIWSNNQKTSRMLTEIDRRMLVTARSLKYMLAEDFHDRAVDETSISYEEELANRKKISDFCRQTEFKWIYTVVEKDGKFYFSAPTVSEEEARQRRSWYFYPYADIPEEFVRAYRQNTIVYVNYSDQWGSFRSIAVPEISPGGRRYLACADYETGRLDALKKTTLVESVLTALFFLACSVPFIVLIGHFLRGTASRLSRMNAELKKHRDHLEELVSIRTLELKAANDRLREELRERRRVEETLSAKNRELEEALAKVKVLSGLIPICSSCKKIRDDKGYWNQLERYLHEHAGTEFTHGICPDCLKRLYPDIKI